MPTEGYVTLTLEFEKEGRRWVGVCKQLGTSTYSRSLTEAEKQLREAVCTHLNTLEDVGERERFFKENGIKVHSAKPRSETLKIDMMNTRHVYIRPYVQKLSAPSMC